MGPDTLTTLSNDLNLLSAFVVAHALVLACVVAWIFIIYILGHSYRQAQRAERLEDAVTETEMAARQSHAAVQLLRNKLLQIEQRLDTEMQQTRQAPAPAPEKPQEGGDGQQMAALRQHLAALQNELDG